MNTLIHLAETWWPLYAVHMVEVSLFILLVWAVDRWLTLETRLRYALYLLALAKVFVPPVLAIPIPAFLVSPATVALDEPVYSGMVSGAVAVSPEPVTTFPPAFYLFCLWTLSVLVWTGVALWKNAAFRRTLRSANPVDLASEVPSLNAPRNLDVFSKTDLPSPILVGLIRPRLFLPRKWSSWTPEELRGVVRHELAHFEKRDIHVLILQAIATALFCANPLIWLLNRRLMYLRELRCDEAVLRETNLTPAEYGRLLLGLVDRRSAPRALTVFFTDRGTTLKKRLEHVLSYKEGRIKRSKRQLAVLILVGLAIVPLSIREAYTQMDSEPQSSISAVHGKTADPEKHQTAESSRGVVDSTEVVSVVYDIEEVDEKPHPVQIFAPDYPEDALHSKIDGVVMLKFIVNVDGSVSDVTALKGPEVFHKAAIEAALLWRFRPAKLRGKVVAAWCTTPMGFSRKPEEKARSIDPVYATLEKGLEFGAIDPVNAKLEKGFEFGAVVDVKPIIIQFVPPVYPDVAQKAAPEVNVFLKFKVNVDGSVSDVRVLGVRVKGIIREGWQTDDTFRRPAIDAISKYRFIPARHEGKAVPVWMTHQISFKLPEHGAAQSIEKSDPGGERVYEFWDVDVKPVVMRAVASAYPDQALKAGLSGNVFLKFKVNVDGSVSDVHNLRGQVIFVKPAIDAISQFRFKPAQRKGKPVAVWMTQAIKFTPTEPEAVPDTDNVVVSDIQVFEISDVDVVPVQLNLNDIRPDYPDAAIKAGLTGRVILKFKINVDGSVNDVNVLEGDEVFRKPAIDAVKRFRYKPAERDGNPVPVWIKLPFTFAIPEDQEDAVPETVEPGVGN